MLKSALALTRPASFTQCLTAIALCISVTGFSSVAVSETIQVPIGQQGKTLNIKLPRSGMKQAQVQEEYGQPINSTAAVGEPPISSWIYPDFVVYFEYDHVVHAVIIHKPQPANQ